MKNKEPILACTKLNKSFGPTHAVDDISFTLNQGDIFGLVGENGAGKSTLIKIIGGECIPDSGNLFYIIPGFKKQNSDCSPRTIISVFLECRG